MISQTSFVVVDLETTGLHPNLDSIVEVAAVKVQNGQVVDEKTTLVNPRIFVPQDTTDITGITTELLQGAPLFEDVVDDFLGFMGTDSVFVAHNVDFDFAFFNSHLRRLSRSELPNPALCTFKLAKVVYPNFPKYGLGVLCDAFGIELPQAHRAIHDARATAQLFIKLLRVLQDGGLRELRDIPGIQNLPRTLAPEGQGSLF